MAKKKAATRRPSGSSRIEVIDEEREVGDDSVIPIDATESDDLNHTESNGEISKPGRKIKKAEPQEIGNFGVAEIRKAAAFANSVGGLDKAISLFQILKVAKEVQ